MLAVQLYSEKICFFAYVYLDLLSQSAVLITYDLIFFV